MGKIKGKIGNDFCPQPLFLYGGYQPDGTPHFGLFCWLSYCQREEDGKDALGVMACIGEEKLTKDLIRSQGVFSANLVTRQLLPLADYYGTTSGREDPGKMRLLPTVEPGQVLHVPTIAESPVSFELQVVEERHFTGHSDIFLCRVCNVMVEESLTDTALPFIQRLHQADPAITAGDGRYASIKGEDLGAWGEPRGSLQMP